ncbi:MAG: hypothetical protein LBK00_05685 [Treponema sp.]|jgi:hypothetical protein|nr:hypothetical protein [Treponema sp.]
MSHNSVVVSHNSTVVSRDSVVVSRDSVVVSHNSVVVRRNSVVVRRSTFVLRQQGVKVILGIAVVMSLNRSTIRRVKVEKSVLRVLAPNSPQGVAALDLSVLEADRVVNGERGPLAIQSFACLSGQVVLEAVIQRIAVTRVLRRSACVLSWSRGICQHPERPRPLYAVEQVRIFVDDPDMAGNTCPRYEG